MFLAESQISAWLSYKYRWYTWCPWPESILYNDWSPTSGAYISQRAQVYSGSNVASQQAGKL